MMQAEKGLKDAEASLQQEAKVCPVDPSSVR